MKLSKKSMVYLSEALQAPRVSANSLEKICDKIEVDPGLSIEEGGSASLENRLWTLIKNLNDSDDLNLLIKVIIKEYGGFGKLKEINSAIQPSGYSVDNSGNVTSIMGEHVKLAETQSAIVTSLQTFGFTKVLSLFDHGVEEYGRGSAFESIRTAIEGLVIEILSKEGISISNARSNFKKLIDIGVLNNKCKQFSIGGQKEDLEVVHAYGIYSLLSDYLLHYGDLNEEEKHFIFLQSVGLFWLLTERYKKYLETKTK